MVKHTNHSLAVACWVVLAAVGTCTLTVYNQQALGSTDPSLLDIQYSIANFGFVPYLSPDAAMGRQSLLACCTHLTSPVNALLIQMHTTTTVSLHLPRE